MSISRVKLSARLEFWAPTFIRLISTRCCVLPHHCTVIVRIVTVVEVVKYTVVMVCIVCIVALILPNKSKLVGIFLSLGGK